MALIHERQFIDEGDKLPILNGAEFTSEYFDLSKLDEIQRQTLRQQSGNQARVEDILFQREILEDAMIASQNESRLRLIHRALHAARKGTVCGRLVFDLRVLNAISLILYGLSTVPDSLHKHLTSDSFAGYSSHDIKGAFRCILLHRSAQALVGVFTGSASLGRATRGMLGMRSLGNIWCNTVYAAMSAVRWSNDLTRKFTEQVLSAYNSDIANGSRLTDNDFVDDPVLPGLCPKTSNFDPNKNGAEEPKANHTLTGGREP
jgi:hypothetical protein